MYSDEYYVAKALQTFAHSGLIAHEYRGYCAATHCAYKTRSNSNEETVRRLASVHAYKMDHKVGIVDHGIVVSIVGHKDQPTLDTELPDW